MFSFKRSIPEEMQVPSKAIKETLEYLHRKEIPMHSFLLMKNDCLIFEKYYAPYTATKQHRMFSISKSFTAIAVSLLADEKKIEFDDKIADYFPEFLPENVHPWILETTIQNMLEMRTCHASCTYKVDLKSNWVESFFTVPPTHKPGTIFHYDTSAAHVLCALVEKLTGTDMLTYLKNKILNYVDFSSDSYMVKDPFGTSIGGSGLMATPMDILKVLYILDKKGTVECSDGVTRTLINPSFIEKATSNISDTIMTSPLPSEAQGYGMQIWQNEKGGFVLYGMGGQLAISIPEKKLLIMTTADTQGIAGGNQVIYSAIYDILLPKIDTFNSDKEFAERDLKEYKELIKYADTLSIAPPTKPENYTYSKIYQVSNNSFSNIHNKYLLQTNSKSFKELYVKINTDDSSLTFVTEDNASYTILFGIDKMQEGLFPIYKTPYVAGGTWLRENVLYIKVNLIGESVGSIRIELYFGNDDITVYMRKIEETYFKEFDGHFYGTIK